MNLESVEEYKKALEIRTTSNYAHSIYSTTAMKSIS